MFSLFMMIVTFISVYSAMAIGENKFQLLNVSNTKRLVLAGAGAVFWPVTLTAGAVVGASVYYHKNVKALPFITNGQKLLGKK